MRRRLDSSRRTSSSGHSFCKPSRLVPVPPPTTGATIPRQIGLGVQVAEIAANHKQGTIEISSSSSDLAIQGDGFFIVEGAEGERLYTRNGIFKLNSDAELVNATGQRLLGYGVDEQFRLQKSPLVPLSVPLGTESVAKATENVTFEGSLTPEGELSTVAQVIESVKLGNDQVPQPDASSVNVGACAAVQRQQRYREHQWCGNPLGRDLPVPRRPGRFQRTMNRLPARRSARRWVWGAESISAIFLRRVGAIIQTSTFIEPAPTATTSSCSVPRRPEVPLRTMGPRHCPDTPLNDNTLTGNYTYMVTFHRAGEKESRPSVLIGPQNVVNGRVTLSDFPTPPVPGADGGFPPYDEIRIYRNLSGDQNNFYLVDTVAPGDIYTDSRSDAEIADLTIPGNQLVDLDGPTINSNTLLTNVLKRDGLTYQNAFQIGTLSYSGRKGARSLGVTSFRSRDFDGAGLD